MKSLSKLALCLLLAMSLTVSAFAAQVPDSLVAENLNGQQRLVKTYTLSPEVDPDELKEEDFSYDGYLYIVARTNVLRAERGIAALTADDQLMRAAQVRADEMAATGTYSHTRPDGRKYYTVTGCRQVGENIHQIPLLYLAQQKTALAETLVYSWSKSAGHMENMTDESYAAIGVGLARGTDANGLECWYCVQLFLRSGYSISAVDKPATK